MIFLVLVFVLTFYGIFKGRDLGEVFEALKMANKAHLLAGIILLIIFVCSESVIIHYMMHLLHRPAPLGNCIKYSFIGFFFSCITPSASGGQPAQIYYMKKDKIDIPVATVVLMIVTIEYKFVLVFIGAMVWLFHHTLIVSYLKETIFFFYLGMGLNIFCVIAMMVLVFEPSLAKRIMLIGLRLLERLHLLKPKLSRREGLIASMEKYHQAAGVFKAHKMAMFNIFLLSLFQRVCAFFITWLVYKAYGLSGTSMVDIVALQATISIAVDMLPLPGGMGASESLFLIIFKPIFGATLILSGLLLSRGISYYGLILISALVTCYAHFTIGSSQARK